MAETKHSCPVCEYQGLDEPPYDSEGWGSFEICPQCGTEFGYDLVNMAFEKDGFGGVCQMKVGQDVLDCLHARLRQEWIDGGRKWWG